jgi:hypothetical protein
MGGVHIALIALAALIVAAWFIVRRARRYLGMPRRSGGAAKRNPTSIRKN